MSLFLGSTRPGGGGGGFSVSRYSSYSRDGERERHYQSERDNDRYSSSRYSTVTSPTSSRRTAASSYTSSATSSYSRFLPSSRWNHHYSDEEPEEERDQIRDRDGRGVR